MASLTALQAPKAIGTKSDGTGSASNILIRAASSGIGTYAVQLAKLTLIRQQRAEDVKKREKEMLKKRVRLKHTSGLPGRMDLICYVGGHSVSFLISSYVIFILFKSSSLEHYRLVIHWYIPLLPVGELLSVGERVLLLKFTILACFCCPFFFESFLTNEDTSVLEESLTSSYQVVNF